jgi:hypothetical protein
MTQSIKIRNNVYEIKKGDYVQYNGSCYIFCTGDKRVLRIEGYSNYDYIKLTAKAVKELDLSLCKVVTKDNITRWYFN